MKKTVLAITALAVSLSAAAGQADSVMSWESGETVVTLARDGTLTVSGQGAMGTMGDYEPDWYDDRSRSSPWCIYYADSAETMEVTKIPLTKAVIRDGVTYIGARAFSGCDDLKSVAIPSSVTAIGRPAFWGAALTSIDVSESNPAFRSVDGVLFSKAEDTLIKYPRNKQGASYIIPDGVTHIYEEAFRGCGGLTSVTIPNSVTKIGDKAFAQCHGLTSVTVHDSVTSIGYGAFYSCKNLKSVTIGKRVKSVGSNAFLNCGSLTSVTIRNGVKCIFEGAFAGCTTMTAVTIPGSVTYILDGAFAGCSKLRSITVQRLIPPEVHNVTHRTHEYFDGDEILLFYEKISPTPSTFQYPGSPSPPPQVDLDSVCLYVPVISIPAYRLAGRVDNSSNGGGWKEFKRVRPIEPYGMELALYIVSTLLFADALFITLPVIIRGIKKRYGMIRRSRVFRHLKNGAVVGVVAGILMSILCFLEYLGGVVYETGFFVGMALLFVGGSSVVAGLVGGVTGALAGMTVKNRGERFQKFIRLAAGTVGGLIAAWFASIAALRWAESLLF